jgi:predicted transcriptional regulator
MIKKLADTDETVVALRHEEGKLHELMKTRSAKEKELSLALERLAEITKIRRQSGLEDEATLLRTGRATDEPTRQHVEKLEHEVQVLDVAIHQQRAEVQKVRGKYSRKLCELNRSEYVRVEKQIADAVQALARANQEEVDFIHALLDAGCASVPFQTMRIDKVGVLSDPQSGASFHQKEFARNCPEAVEGKRYAS